MHAARARMSRLGRCGSTATCSSAAGPPSPISIDMHTSNRSGVGIRGSRACPCPSTTTRVGRLQVGHAHGDRAQAPDLVLGRHGAAVPRMRLARRRRRPPGRDADLPDPRNRARGVRHARPISRGLTRARQSRSLPPLQSALPANAQGGAGDAVGAAPLAAGRQVEKCEVGAGGRQRRRHRTGDRRSHRPD